MTKDKETPVTVELIKKVTNLEGSIEYNKKWLINHCGDIAKYGVEANSIYDSGLHMAELMHERAGENLKNLRELLEFKDKNRETIETIMGLTE